MSTSRDHDSDRTQVIFKEGSQVFGRYTLRTCVGEGGMGVVWRAQDDKLEREVALKFLPEQVRRDPEAIRDLKRETTRCLRLTHENIVRVHDFVEDGSCAAISMEFVPGKSLSALKAARPGGCFDPADLQPLLRQLCAALDYAHGSARIVHRDLKPANLLVTEAGVLKVADFGIARSLVETHTRHTGDLRGASGTLPFMGPQQLMNQPAAPTDDVYALGATLYDLLTGKPPFFGGDLFTLIREVQPETLEKRRAELENTGGPIPAEWERTVFACLAKKAEERPQKAGEVLALLSPFDGDKLAGLRPAEGEGAKTDRDRTIKVGQGPAAKSSAELQPALELQSNVAERGLPPSPSLGRTGKLRATDPHGPDRQSVIENRRSKIPLVAGLAAGAAVLALGAWWYFGSHVPAQKAEEARRQHLANARGGLVVRTLPEGAEVRVGGMALDKSPLTMKEVKLGKYPVQIRLEGYDPVDRELEVKENLFTDPGVIALRRSTGRLQLASEPPGQEFSLAGGLLEKNERRGTAPAEFELPTGSYDIIFTRRGWAPVAKKIEVKSGARVPATAIFPQGELAVESAGAQFRLSGGEPVAWSEAGEPPKKFTLPPGRYRVELSREGWLPVERVAEIVAGGTTTASAEFAAGTISLTSEPAGADFVLAGGPTGKTRQQGRAPAKLEVPAGKYTATFSRNGWLPVRREFEVPGSGEARAAAEFPAGELKLTTDLAGLPFSLSGGPDGRQARSGKTPATLSLPVGSYQVEFSREGGWAAVKKTIDVAAGKSAAAGAEFPAGSVVVESTPPGAEVWQEGKRLGTTPLTLADRPPGKIEVEIKLKGYWSETIQTEVKARTTGRAAKALRVDHMVIPGLNLELREIPAGSFTMGSPASEAGRSGAEGPQTRVTISKRFWLGKTEVTQREWSAVMGSNPSNFKGENLPVGGVSWTDAMEFCRKLTERERAASRLPEGYAYTLPTEAQWEYACRAGTTGDYAGNLDEMGWYKENSGNQTHPVGQKRANGWGLHDMHGNVWEWCLDWYGNYPGGSVTDPKGAGSGSVRVLRGGCWNYVAGNCRSANRGGNVPGFRNGSLGFRLVLAPQVSR